MKTVRTLIMSLVVFAAGTQRLFADELLIFTAAWCGPCQALKRDLAANPDTVKDYKWGFVNFDTEKELVKQFGIRVVPTLILLDDSGNEMRRQTGYTGLEKLKRWLKGLASLNTSFMSRLRKR